MKAQKIIELLNTKNYDELLKLAKDELLDESIKDRNIASTYKKVASAIKKQKQRVLLQKAVLRNDMQLFTNTIVAVQLKKEYMNPFIELCNDDEAERYPAFDNIFSTARQNTTLLKLNVSEILQSIATLKLDKENYITFRVDSEAFSYIKFDIKELELLLNGLLFKSSDEITFKVSNYNYNSPVYTENDCGAGVIMPVRC